MDRVIDYPARDMTITVEAGITIAELQKILAAENQELPIDVPQPELTTLGGAIATNASGPRRFGLGTWARLHHWDRSRRWARACLSCWRARRKKCGWL